MFNGDDDDGILLLDDNDNGVVSCCCGIAGEGEKAVGVDMYIVDESA